MKVLFLCTGNSCRSQMAEGFATAMGRVEAYSAGTRPKGLDPRAVKVMREVGVEIGGQWSKRVGDIVGVTFDVVVSVCARADESCPVIAGARVVRRAFDDPPQLAAGEASEEGALAHYRRVRDQIREFVAGMPGNIGG